MSSSDSWWLVMGISLGIQKKTQWYENNNANEIDGMTQEGKSRYLHVQFYLLLILLWMSITGPGSFVSHTEIVCHYLILGCFSISQSCFIWCFFGRLQSYYSPDWNLSLNHIKCSKMYLLRQLINIYQNIKFTDHPIYF